jgi:PEP-CTERM motif
MQGISDTGGRSFTTLDLAYGTDGTTWTNFDTIAIGSNGLHTLNTANLPNAAAGQTTLFLQFCFSGATGDAGNNYIDNIQLTATAVPEPSSYIGALLGVVGLCWFQRRRFTRFLRLRSA